MKLWSIIPPCLCAAIIHATVATAGDVPGRETAMTGWATYYTAKSCQREGTSGVLTASGARYDESLMTCALPFHPPRINGRRAWGAKYRVTNLRTGLSTIVTHMDYGPGRQATKVNMVVIDLTPAAFVALGGKLHDGKIKVRIEEVK